MHKIKSLQNLEELKKALEKAKHPKLYLFDIKDFKEINIRYGDDAGNFILDSIALSFEDYANKSEMQLFYVKDDEFALLEDVPFDLELMEKKLFELLALCDNQTYMYDDLDVEFEIELIFGICVDKTNLLDKAYRALNLAKAQDRPFITYSEFVNKEWSQTKKIWADIIENAIKNKRLFPHFQAVLNKEGEVKYFETLSRININNETKSPNDFLNIVKSQNLTKNLTKNMFRSIKEMKSPKPCTLNLGIDDIKDKSTIELLKESDEIIYEIPLDDINENFSHIKNFINSLNIPAKRIILDNVSSIGVFEEDGIDINKIGTIKIDGNLIKNLHLDAIAVKRVKNIKEFASKNNIQTVAIHVNSKDTFEIAKNLNIDLFQGYLFQKPTPTPSITIQPYFK